MTVKPRPKVQKKPGSCKRCGNPVAKGHSPFCEQCHVLVQDNLARYGIDTEPMPRRRNNVLDFELKKKKK